MAKKMLVDLKPWEIVRSYLKDQGFQVKKYTLEDRVFLIIQGPMCEYRIRVLNDLSIMVMPDKGTGSMKYGTGPILKKNLNDPECLDDLSRLVKFLTNDTTELLAEMTYDTSKANAEDRKIIYDVDT